MAILVIASCTSDPDDIPDLDEVCEEFEKSPKDVNSDENPFNYTSKSTLSLYEDRMIGVFRDMYEFGYI